MARWVLLMQLASTVGMTGIVWFVQVVHYPLFALVGKEDSATYEAQHATRTGWVVGPVMCVELATAVLFLLPRFRPVSIAAGYAWSGAVLAAILWLSTFLIQMPLHTRLAAGRDAATITRLVATNWVRTMTWTARAALLLIATAKALRG